MNWPSGVWVLLAGLLILALPYLIRLVVLSGVTDLPEPFDIDEFSNWDVPDEENAFTDYAVAAAIKANLGTIEQPPSFESVMNDGWSRSDEALLSWMQRHRESLEVWRRGTARQQGRCLSPRDISIDRLLKVVAEQRFFSQLATLEISRSLEKNELDEAFEWGRAILRFGGHMTHRGCLMQELVGVALHDLAASRIRDWAEHPQVTSVQLTSALAAVRKDDNLYAPPSSVLKAEYLYVEKVLTSGEWVGFFSPFDAPPSGALASGLKAGAWVIGEPELMRRLNRQVIANLLREIDKPMTKRTKRAGSAQYDLFDLDPAVPLLPGQMTPQDINQKIRRSIMMMQFGPSTNVDRIFQRRRVRQSALEILLAVQACHRDRGQFPGELAELVPKYLDQIPLDDFDPSGSTMRYRRNEDGSAVVWSAGTDGIDGNGDVVLKEAPPLDIGFVIKQPSEK